MVVRFRDCSGGFLLLGRHVNLQLPFVNVLSLLFCSI
jgi:hypothetical protein